MITHHERLWQITRSKLHTTGIITTPELARRSPRDLTDDLVTVSHQIHPRHAVVTLCPRRNRILDRAIQGVSGQFEVFKIGLTLCFHGACYDGQDAYTEGTEFETEGLGDDFDGSFGGSVASCGTRLVLNTSAYICIT